MTPTAAAVANMKLLRSRQGMTAQQLADNLTESGHAITRQAISRIENGDRGVSLDLGYALASAFGVTIDQLCQVPCERCQGFPPSGYTCGACGKHGAA